MEVYQDIKHLPAFDKPVITIGSFDGLHKGHQEILDRVRELSTDAKRKNVVITFEPHPRQVIYPRDNQLRLLTDLEEKTIIMAYYDVDYLVVVPFTVEFSQMLADDYIENFLVKSFNPGKIVIGYDHKFGLNRQGDINYLKWHSEKFDYEVVEISEKQVNDISVSSTKIRNKLSDGDVKRVNELLGHPYVIIGTVVHGQKLGTEIGFPTANISFKNQLKLIPPDGIYAVIINVKNKAHKGVMYIGNKPTLGVNKKSLEVHIFDFDDDIYEETVMVEFVDHVRADRRFGSVDEMARQISKDKDAAIEILKDSTSTFNKQWSTYRQQK